jgi:hypothetical protein
MAAFIFNLKDREHNFPIAGTAFLRYPNLLNSFYVPGATKILLKNAPGKKNRILSEYEPKIWPENVEVSRGDVEVIGRLTKPGDRVALFSSTDWVYLLAAQRAPKSVMVPCKFLAFDWMIEETFANAELIFVEFDKSERLGLLFRGLYWLVDQKQPLTEADINAMQFDRNQQRLGLLRDNMPSINNRLATLLARDYVFEAEGETIRAYRKKEGH